MEKRRQSKRHESSKRIPTIYRLLLLLIIVQLVTCAVGSNLKKDTTTTRRKKNNHVIDHIYQFGDSLSDTGNFALESPSFACTSSPYGETAFGRPTGRCSDGFLMIDFFAKALKLPLLNPYLKRGADFRHGVNFAVAGATALNASFLASRNIIETYTNSSLSVQLGWFRAHLDSISCSKSVKHNRLKKPTLIIIGEFGANDLNLGLLQGKPVQDLYKLVPYVVSALKTAVQQVVHKGATKVFVPGNFPFGCMPFARVLSDVDDPAAASLLDDLKCVKSLNELVKYYNTQLQLAIKDLQKQHPRAAIIYGDLYSAFIRLLKNAPSLGFKKDELFKTCCGSGNNPYNFNFTRLCGSEGVTSCSDPTKRIHWDGFHFTHQANKYLAKYLLKSIIMNIY